MYIHIKLQEGDWTVKYVWDLQHQHLDYEVQWSIAQRAAPYKCGTRQCDVCLSEKMVIALVDPSTLLNKRAEIVSTCRHRAKFLYDKASNVPI